VVARIFTYWSPSPLIGCSISLHLSALLGLSAWPGGRPWFVGALAANHAALTALGLLPRSTLLGPNVKRLPAPAVQRRQVALTFDDGPHPTVTPQVLDLLDRWAMRASFFCIGARAAAHPAIVREIHRRGHDVQNHSENHPRNFACLSPSGLVREIGTAQARLADIVGVPPRFFRPPMGFRSPFLDPVLAHLGLHHVSWTRRGYDAVSDNATRIVSRLSRSLSPGDILLLHDGRPTIILDVLSALFGLMGAARLSGTSLMSGLPEDVCGSADGGSMARALAAIDVN
jgi:peptidoglycan/xylan/chitin deacetylase (PgdA/CDA1 family)